MFAYQKINIFFSNAKRLCKTSKLFRMNLFKIILCFSLLIFQFKIFANDTLAGKPILNIYYNNLNAGPDLYLKLPQKKVFLLKSGNYWHSRAFIKINLTDTGKLQIFLFHVTHFQRVDNKLQQAKPLSINIDYTGERWLCLTDARSDLRRIRKKGVRLLTNEKFKQKFKRPHRLFARRNYNFVFDSVAVNTIPSRNVESQF